MLAEGRIERVAVVAPTTHICRQWAADAARYGIDLEPNRPNAAGPEPRDRHGVAVTYATLAAGPSLHRRRCAEAPTLLIADEPHHMGELATWGRSTQAAFERAGFRLLLSGTPFRSDNTPIPWVSYDEDGVSSADYAYGYTDALMDGVCRPVTFHTYDGDMEWMSDGRRRRADFTVGLPAAEAARRLRTALDPDGEWIAPRAARRARRSWWTCARATTRTPAGSSWRSTRSTPSGSRTGSRGSPASGPTIVTSDAPDACARISRFAAGNAPWLVSVLMVSEGVDVPRLRVGVYATTARTELFFRQVVGRFVRRTPTPREQMSHVFLPSDPALKRLAGQIEEERNHALEAKPEGEALERGERTEPGDPFRALWSSARRDDDVMQTTQPGDALQLFAEAAPGARPPRWPRSACRPPPRHGGGRATRRRRPRYERRERLRDERRALVAAIVRRTGEEHRAVDARVNREVGARSVAKATVDQLERANRLLEKEAGRWSRRRDRC